jgi:hypothetical protein
MHFIMCIRPLHGKKSREEEEEEGVSVETNIQSVIQTPLPKI